MKKLSLAIALVCLGFLAFSTAAWADKPAETVIAHCGCNYDGDAMEWQIITVNPNSKGHQNHETDDTEVCWDPTETYSAELDRDYDDCELAGSLDGLAACGQVWLQDAPCGDFVAVE